MAGLDPDILEQVRTIVRRDLKLRPDEPLAEDMRLFSSELDLDSLDMLLLLTSIERQFGVRIPSQEVGKEVFQNIGTLSRYVQEHRGQRPAAAPISAPADWLAQLPHGPAFRFISRVMEVNPGESARGVWALSGQEPFFAGHFPGNPIVPGMLLAEAMAQLAGFAGPVGSGSQGKLVHVDVRFERAVAPPVEVELSAKLSNVLGQLQSFAGQLQSFVVTARVGDTVLAQGSITLHRSEGGEK